MSKGSDKNVGSIEEDIRILQKKDCMWHYPETRIEEAIENIIADYTRQKEMNEEHQRINGELREKVKELEEENRIFALEGSKIRLSLYIQENYISRDEITKALEVCEKVYEEEMKPYQREYGLDVTYLNKKEKAELINKRNCLITQMETYKQILKKEDK